MSEWILAQEATIRLSIFLAVFLGMAAWETTAPRRRMRVRREQRWPTNLGMVFFNALILRAAFPFAAVGVAWLLEQHPWGLCYFLQLPYALAVVGSALALDFIIYLQHLVFHAVPALWRLHQVHHTDVEFDVTTGNRFHAIEILLSMLIKAGAIVALGAPVLAVLIFEVVLNSGSMFNHSNVVIPARIERVLRWFLVTPDMHRVHHSCIPGETDSNFGFNLPWWDRLFGTYCDQPAEGHEGMDIGLSSHRDARKLKLPKLLGLPFADRGVEIIIRRK